MISRVRVQTTEILGACVIYTSITSADDVVLQKRNDAHTVNSKAAYKHYRIANQACFVSNTVLSSQS